MNQEAHQQWTILEPLHFAQSYPSSVSKTLQSRCKVQDLAPHLSFYQSSCHHPSQHFFEVSSVRVSSSCLPSLFDHTIFDLLISKFIKVHHTDGGIWTKNKLLVPLWWCLWWLLKALLFFSYSFDVVYSTFWQGLTMMSCSLFIISFVTPIRFCNLLFYTSKNPSSS